MLFPGTFSEVLTASQMSGTGYSLIVTVLTFFILLNNNDSSGHSEGILNASHCRILTDMLQVLQWSLFSESYSVNSL